MNTENGFVIVNIDDNDMNLLLIQSYLSTLDATFVNFTDSLEALDYLRHHPCDMVIVDYKMPKMDGISLTREVKSIDSEIPVIMVTASSTEDAVQIEALEAGVNDFIIKPINKAILLNRVQNFIKLRRAIIRLTHQEKRLQHQVDAATQDLQRHIADLEAAQQITHLGSWTWQIAEGGLEWSDETFRIFDLLPRSISPTYEKFLEFVHPDEREAVKNAVTQSLRDRRPYNIRHRILTPSRIKHVQERGNIYYDEHGRPLYMVGTVYDITEVTEAYQALEKKEHETLRILSRTAEYKDEETFNHIKRVSEYAVLMARYLGLDEHEQELLRYAAPLHDIGKVGIPDHILLKPGRLDNDEMRVMREHARIGANILQETESPFLRAGHVIALTHHEKYDGSGYPQGLRGDAIPLHGRIVAIADVFDALTSKRPYKEAWSFEEAMAFMHRQSGIHFDPSLIEIFAGHREEIREIYRRYED